MYYVYCLEDSHLYKCKSNKAVDTLINISYGPGYKFYITNRKLKMDRYLYELTLRDLNISLKNWTKRNIFDDYIFKLKQLHNLI